MAKDINKNNFDDGTNIKLELFKLYLREWLPVFISRKERQIEVFDFFAGSGTDASGSPGSPIVILNEISAQCAKLISNGIKLKILFNDIDGSKIDQLQENIGKQLQSCGALSKYGFCDAEKTFETCPFDVKFFKEDFQDLFRKFYPYFNTYQKIPRLVFIDQYGIKHVTENIFSQLVSLKRTDFIFFLSSSFLRRFKEQPEFLKYLDTLKIEFDTESPYTCHREVFNYFKSLIGNRRYFMGQFSIRKNANIYGVIFGSNHPLGLKKFLDVAWKLDTHTGETNFNIDNDSVRTGQILLDFENDGKVNKIKKLVAYEIELVEFLKTERSSSEIYIFSIEKGISIKKTNEILRNLEHNNRLSFQGEIRRKGGFYLEFDPKKKIKIKVL